MRIYKPSKTGLYVLACTCFILELGSASFLRVFFGMYISPIIFILSAVFLAAVLLVIVKRKESLPIQIKLSNQLQLLIPVLFFIAFAFSGWSLLKTYFPRYPIDPSQSDIIPLIKIVTHRFASGEKVYSEVNDFGYTMYPNYLPMTWMPFLIVDWLHLEYRTWAYIIFSACILLSVLSLKAGCIERLIFLFLPFLIFFVFLINQPPAFGWTVETMIAGFYMFLLYGLYKKSTALIAASLICCLLSRYAIILLLPFLAIVFFYFVSKRKTFLITGLTTAGILCLFVFPFFVHQPDILVKGYNYYTQGALAEWKGQRWQQPGALPYQLSQGYGFAIFFYSKQNVQVSLFLLQRVHIAVCLLLPLPGIIWYFLKAKEWLPANIFMLLLLHLYSVFFFAFIQVPYAYLFFTPLIISASTAALVCFSLSKKTV